MLKIEVETTKGMLRFQTIKWPKQEGGYFLIHTDFGPVAIPERDILKVKSNNQIIYVKT
jgi:hypothetical protein